MSKLNPIRAQLVELIQQAGNVSCEITYYYCDGTLSIDTAGTITLTGWTNPPYPVGVTLEDLSFMDLAKLAEAASENLN